jgi:catechol 2,3-dioxygenase-like lactoylglutathione lyase family enzyme
MAITYDGSLNVLFTADLTRARDFYQNVMGLEHVHGTDDDLLSTGDVDSEPARGARFVMATEVADVDAASAPGGYPARAPSGAVLVVRVFQRARVRGNVDRVLLERGERDDLKRALVGGGEHDRRGEAVLVGAQPVRRGDAPPVARDEAREAELRHRGDQVVADTPLVLEELARHHRANGMTAQVLRTRGAAAVPVEAGERVSSTRLKLAAEHIPFTHPSSIDSVGPRPQPSAAEHRQRSADPAT